MNRKIAKLIDPSISDELGFDVVEALSDIYTQNFFGGEWKPHPQNHPKSGEKIVERVNSFNPSAVLDYGCGYNIYKDSIPNLIGLDPFNPHADFQIKLRDFGSARQFDAILCLGSLNFGAWSGIELEFQLLDELLAPGGRMFFRVNPGHQWEQAPYVDIYEWTEERAQYLADAYGYKLVCWESDGMEGTSYHRYYFELHKAD